MCGRDYPHHNTMLGAIVIASESSKEVWSQAMLHISESVGPNPVTNKPWMPNVMNDDDSALIAAMNILREQYQWTSKVFFISCAHTQTIFYIPIYIHKQIQTQTNTTHKQIQHTQIIKQPHIK